DINSSIVMNSVLDNEQTTGLVVLNGDLITGENTFLHNSTKYVDSVVAPLVKRGMSWASTYGNHDSDFNLSRQGIFEEESKYPLSRTKNMVLASDAGVSNYYLPVYGNNSAVPEFLLWFFDSRGGNYFQQESTTGTPVPQPNWVSQSVVDWFTDTRSALEQKHGHIVPSVAFVHIPVNAMAAFQVTGVNANHEPGINDDNPLAQQGSASGQGEVSGTTFSYNGQDIPFMQALLDTKGLKAVFSGHDHGDDWCFRWDSKLKGMNLTGNGLDLCFSRHSGYGGYGSWIRGSRQVVLKKGQEDVETWGPIYATKLFYQGADAIGSAAGHYVGADGENNLVWESASIVNKGDTFIDVSFVSEKGDLHWVIYDDLAGSYQYFVNRALGDISILRSLFRLDPDRFPNGRTYLKDEPLPLFAAIQNATKVQDETFETSNGTYITKYDWSNYVRDRDFHGVYGPSTGSWYIHPSTDYFSGSHLKQTLTVHRESSTGDAVQLNVVQDTSHFQTQVTTSQPVGKIWGPWLWYLNDGDVADAARKHKDELSKWPYHWVNDTAYHSRGSVTGSLRLSDGRVAAGAAVFLGDSDIKAPLAQGTNYYYTTYADAYGRFNFSNVRTGGYGIYAWSNGGEIGDVYTNFTKAGIDVKGKTNLSTLTWFISNKKRIFQIGDFDKKTTGFINSGPYHHGLAALSPANFTYNVGTSNTSDWYYASSNLGTWNVEFDVPVLKTPTAKLVVSLAGYSQSTALTIFVNDVVLDSLNKDNVSTDASVYRSGTVSGEWHQFEYVIDNLKQGRNVVSFEVDRYVLWRGFLWDAIALEWIE
ncbi:polysaccharide lyase family 4 protein, partial [Aureobasidium melanogenum]